MRVLRNVAIVALIALLLTVLPAGGNLATGILAALSLAFVGSIAMLAVRFWRERSMARDALSDRERGLIYTGLGAIALMVVGTDELLDTGPGTIAWLLVIAVSGWLIYTTWRSAF
ncbi:MAG: hypothetical protein ABIZ50_02580 [Solirubrobacterales bacterium]